MSRHNMLEQYDRVAKSYAMRQRLRRRADASDDDETDDDRRDGDGDTGDRHLIDTLADLIVEAGSPDGKVSREDALRFLLHSRSGQALVTRMAQHRKAIDGACSKLRKDSTMDRSQHVRAAVRKAGGVFPLCKSIIAKGATDIDITEHELTQLIVDAAKREYPDLSDAQAFAKAFSAAGQNGETLRKAVAIAKTAQVGGDDADAEDAAAALEELHRLAERHHRDNPELTPEQSFARVFADPRHAALAHRAHKRPTANEKMFYPFPR
jgi:hypothetical protein